MSQTKNKSKLFGVSFSMSFLMGIYFGIILVKSEVVQWTRVHKMFLFQEPHMYLIIGVGVVVAMISLQLLRRMGAKSLTGRNLVYKPKPFTAGTILGGICFGAGWAITGACPGPIYAQIGAGAWPALFTLAGALVGMYGYAWLNEWTTAKQPADQSRPFEVP
jgi:uncharacterized protein